MVRDASLLEQVFYEMSYHPIQAGIIDGTDVVPHDNGVCRSLLFYNAGLYDPSGDSKAAGDPYCSLFVGRLSLLTKEDTIRETMSKYGKIKTLRLVRHIMTGVSRAYAFVEFETEKEMRRAYEVRLYGVFAQRRPVLSFDFRETATAISEEPDGHTIYVGNASADLASSLPLIYEQVFLNQHLTGLVFDSGFSGEEIAVTNTVVEAETEERMMIMEHEDDEEENEEEAPVKKKKSKKEKLSREKVSEGGEIDEVRSKKTRDHKKKTKRVKHTVED